MNDSTCGCCEGTDKVTPEPTANRPGLNALRYRVGTHATFLETMQASLSQPALLGLTTREISDPALAMLDAGATMLDVLTFYQERIANEGYLRTATERRSILELARLVGYKLRPGVSASVYLAFTLDNGYVTEIPAGTRTQSIPNPGELAQSFETSEPLAARAEWNTLTPRPSKPQFIPLQDAFTREKIYFQGTSTNLKANDPLLLVYGNATGAQVFRFADSVASDVAKNLTTVDLQSSLALVGGALVKTIREITSQYMALNRFGVSENTQMAQRVTSLLKSVHRKLSANMSEVEVTGLLNDVLISLNQEHAIAQEGDYAKLEPWVGGLVKALGTVDNELTAGASGPEILAVRKAASSASGTGGFSLAGLGELIQPLLTPPSIQPSNSLVLARDYKNLFGPQADTLPHLLTTFQPKLKNVLYKAWGSAQFTPTAPLQSANALRVKAAPFGYNAPLKVIQNQETGVIEDYTEWPLVEEPTVLVLDTQYDQIKPGSWVVIERPVVQTPDIELRGRAMTFFTGEFELLFRQVIGVRTLSKAAYGLSGKATHLTLNDEWISEEMIRILDSSFLRKVTVFAQSEALSLAEEPVSDDISGNSLELGALFDDLEAGRWLIVSGERTDIPGVTGIEATELVMISGVTQGVAQVDRGGGKLTDLPGDKTHTTLQLANSLAYTYKRDTVTIYGNVVKATHGETRDEVLGNGDTSKKFQAFTLKQFPLTYVSAPTPSGIESTLEVRVNSVRWPKAEGLLWLGPHERGYTTKTSDDGKTTIIFGDGEHGLRLPTGPENLKARYRFGIGKPGNVKAKQISLLASKPLGVKSVINPLPATGGADSENRDQARENVPLAVMALDRLVSVQDYADFARTFAGVGKASAVRLSDGRRELVHVTIAGADDIPIAPTSDLYQNLLRAFQQFNGDPFQPVALAVRKLKLLVVVAKVRLLADYEWEAVAPTIRAAMLDTFSFFRRKLGQDIVSSEVISTIQSVAGVAYVDLEVMDAIDEDADLSDLANLAQTLTLHDRISVALARLDPNIRTLPRPVLSAQLAYLSPDIADMLILSEIS
ncbi:MAG TPA: putative baseplate assembly protein [Anaerolineales bacterium]|nr:putative baseplate assembly protein [Anaerolineales bacterium]